MIEEGPWRKFERWHRPPEWGRNNDWYVTIRKRRPQPYMTFERAWVAVTQALEPERGPFTEDDLREAVRAMGTSGSPI